MKIKPFKNLRLPIAVLILVSCVANLGLSHNEARRPASAISGYDIVVVAGQSNAAGWGVGNYESAGSEKLPDVESKLFQWDWDQTENKLAQAQDPLKTPALTNAKKIRGFALPFATAYAQNILSSPLAANNRAVLIINGAVGGSSIEEWGNQGSHYRRLIEAVREASQYQQLDNRVIAVLWHQGEADLKLAAQDPQAEYRLKNYNERLAEVVRSFRADLSHGGVLPFIAGEMSREWKEMPVLRDNFVNNKKATLAAIPFTGYVSSEGLTGNKKDKIHFDGRSQGILGQRYFEQFLKLSVRAPSCRALFRTEKF